MKDPPLRELTSIARPVFLCWLLWSKLFEVVCDQTQFVAFDVGISNPAVAVIDVHVPTAS